MKTILNLVAKSNLKIVDWAYCDLLGWGYELTDERIIEEIEYKLDIAKYNYYSDSDDEFNKRDFYWTERFLNKLKNMRNKNDIRTKNQPTNE